jgi:hypothetical protein
MSDAITRAMESVMRAAELVSDWPTQRRLLAAYDALAIARREGMAVSTNEPSMRSTNHGVTR